jgi:vacuolar-type H+-ATPase subunit I/STV1
MAAKLKVFRYSDGFHAWTVAASSRPKALQAWGVKRDLFKDGSAEQIEAGPDYDAALRAPGELIERGLAVDVGEVTRKATPRRSKADEKAKARVEALEIELAELDAAQAAQTEALEARRAELEREAAALAKRQSKAREALKAKLKAARAKLS